MPLLLAFGVAGFNKPKANALHAVGYRGPAASRAPYAHSAVTEDAEQEARLTQSKQLTSKCLVAW